MINTIYYATDDSLPKSYDRGREVEVGVPESGDLMIVQGPLGINWRDWRHIAYPSYEDGSITNAVPPDPKRIDKWIETDIHVRDNKRSGIIGELQ